MISGYCDEKFSSARELFENNLKSGFERGAAITVEIEGEKVIADFLVKHGNLETAFMIEKSETALSEYETPPNIKKLFSLYPSVERINYTSNTSNADFFCRSKAIIEKVLDELCLK